MAHVLFITHWYPAEDNPVNGVFIREHARAIALYHQVSIIHIQGISPVRPGIEKVLDENLTVYRLSYPRPILPKTGWLYRFLSTRRIFRELILAKNQPDIIHANIYSSSDLAYVFSRLYHLPALLSEHASVYPRNLLSTYQQSYYRFFMNRLRLIMPVSRDLQQHMQKAGFRGPFMVIPNAVDTTIFHPAARAQIDTRKPITILCVAMLQPVKGLGYLLEALASLRSKSINGRLWLAGEGPERQALQELAEKLQLSGQVSFLGLRSKAEIAELMREADLFCLTSIWENQPVALIEAMASGLPVEAPAVGGIPEIVSPDFGELFVPGDVGDLVDKLVYMIDHLEAYSASASAEYAAHTFSLQAIGRKFSAVYETML
jgi:glycosyltransferase involved in cell wall biosynthesis